jgi:hypothetical protein
VLIGVTWRRGVLPRYRLNQGLGFDCRSANPPCVVEKFCEIALAESGGVKGECHWFVVGFASALKWKQIVNITAMMTWIKILMPNRLVTPEVFEKWDLTRGYDTIHLRGDHTANG